MILIAKDIGHWIKKVIACTNSELQVIMQGIQQKYIDISLINKDSDTQTKEHKRLAETEFI